MKDYRDAYWDVLKFVLISLVIFGHTLYLNIPKASLSMALFNTVYAFHMPLFVFISGRFSKKRDKRRYALGGGIIKLAESFIIFTLLHILFRHYVISSAPLWKPTYIFYPEETLWYLQCIIYWRILISITPSQVLKHKYAVVCTSLFLAIIGGFIPVQFFSIQRALCFFPFFMLGYYSSKNINDRIKHVPATLCIAILFAVIVAFYIFVPSSMEKIFTGQYAYTSLTMALYRILFFMLAVLLSISVMRLSMFPPLLSRVMAKYGRDTLLFYLYHWFFVQLVSIAISHQLITGSMLEIVACTMIITIIIMMFTRFAPFRWLLNPFTSLIQSPK